MPWPSLALKRPHSPKLWALSYRLRWVRENEESEVVMREQILILKGLGLTKGTRHYRLLPASSSHNGVIFFFLQKAKKTLF